jgi:tetratricopeptide (TPR) repeat protein
VRSFRLDSLLAGLVASLALAHSAAAHGEVHGEIEALTKRVAQSPKCAELFYRRGELHRLHRDWAAALRDFERALALDPRLDGARFAHGRTLLEAGRPKEALPVLDAFLAHHAEHGEAHVWRARALAALGRHADAAAGFERAVALLRRPRPGHFVEHARALADAQRPAAAVEALDKGMRALGAIVTLQSYAIELELSQGRHDAAIRRVEAILARARRPERWLFKLGEIQERAGRKDRAAAAYRAALKAIAALPPSHRGVAATRELAATIQARAEKLARSGG